jgi:hypothetical protein
MMRAGNVIETHEHTGEFKNACAADLLSIQDGLRCRFAQFKVGAHLL